MGLCVIFIWGGGSKHWEFEIKKLGSFRKMVVEIQKGTRGVLWVKIIESLYGTGGGWVGYH